MKNALKIYGNQYNNLNALKRYANECLILDFSKIKNQYLNFRKFKILRGFVTQKNIKI